MNIALVMAPQERRYRAKIAQCEANIRRFDSSGRDNPRRNYWWRQRRGWERKLHPWLKIPLCFNRADFPGPDLADDMARLLSQIEGKFATPKYLLTGFDEDSSPSFPVQLTVDAEKYRAMLAASSP